MIPRALALALLFDGCHTVGTLLGATSGMPAFTDSLRPTLPQSEVAEQHAAHGILLLPGILLSAASAVVCRSMDAVIGFLAEAAAQATRRPHEPWELAQTLLAGSAPHGGPITSRGVSGLSVCCLRNARKVAASARMPAEARAAICGFVSGAFLMSNRWTPSRACWMRAQLTDGDQKAMRRSASKAIYWLPHARNNSHTECCMLAGAVMQIIQTQAEPRPLCTVVTQLMAAEPNRPHVLEQTATPEAKSAAASPGGSQAGSTRSRKRRRADADDTGSLPGFISAAGEDEASAGGGIEPRSSAAHPPPEARPLASLAAFAAEVLAAQAGAVPGPVSKNEERPRKLKKNRKADGVAADLESVLHADLPRYYIMPCNVVSFLADSSGVLLAC